jgi:hypothetical protein
MDVDVKPRPLAALTLGLVLLAGAQALEARQDVPEELRTHAERSGWTELTPHDDVIAFYRILAERSPEARLRTIGESREGRPILLVTLSRPAVAEPWEAHASGRPILFIGAQVHGDEQAGKEGLMLLARDLAVGPLSHLLDEVVFVLVPQINPDAAEAGTWGTRTNRAGYNVNRDYSRLVNPETRAVVEGALAPWRPHVMVDAHELTGARWYDFYALHSSNLNGPGAPRALSAGPATEAVRRAIEDAGYTYFPYHLQPSDPTRVAEEGILAAGYGVRILRTYGGARGAVALLFESRRERDARIRIEERTRWQRIAMGGLAEYVAGNAQEVLSAVEEGREEMRRRGARWDPADSIVVRVEFVQSRVVDYRMPEMRRGPGDDEWEPTGRILDLQVPAMDSAVAVLSRVRPVGYLIEPHRADLASHLAAHGLQVERFPHPVEARVESFQVDSVRYASDPAEGYIHRDVWTSTEARSVTVPRGAFLVRATQPMATLAFALLEPEDIDSYASVGKLSAEKRTGEFLPVHRLREIPRGSPTLLEP